MQSVAIKGFMNTPRESDDFNETLEDPEPLSIDIKKHSKLRIK